MGLTFTYSPLNALGSQYSIVGSRSHLLAAILTDGYSETDANKLIERALAEAKANKNCAVVRVPRKQTTTVETDREVVAAFITEAYVPRRDSSTLFATFYDGFIAWLSPTLRPNWLRKRLAQALNRTPHPSVPGNRNVRVIRDLAKRPA